MGNLRQKYTDEEWDELQQKIEESRKEKLELIFKNIENEKTNREDI